MDWKLNLPMGIGGLTLVASVVGALEQILRFLGRVVRPMLKKWYLRKRSWPIKITIREIAVQQATYPTAMTQSSLNTKVSSHPPVLLHAKRWLKPMIKVLKICHRAFRL